MNSYKDMPEAGIVWMNTKLQRDSVNDVALNEI